MPINTTGDLHIGSQNALFELKVRLGIGFGRCGYDVTPEGRFVMMRPFRDESAFQQLHFIFNWTAGLDE